MVELAALCWLHVIYGARIEELKRSPYLTPDVNEITGKVLEFNLKYNLKYRQHTSEECGAPASQSKSATSTRGSRS